MNMREKIARVIRLRNTLLFDQSDPPPWEELSEETRGEWLDDADAVLAAIREPDEAMIEAGRAAWLESASDYTKLSESIAAAWQAMIDEASHGD